MEFWFLYIVLGTVAGLLAGLLGLGGGIVIVPMLTFAFSYQGLPVDHILHLALGTSLATIIFTSLSSLRAHHVRGTVLWSVVRGTTPGILAGTMCGSWLAAQMSTYLLKVFFVVFLYYVASQMLLEIPTKATRQVPGRLGLLAMGVVIGGISSLVGIGGGSLSVPLLLWCNTPVLAAVGTSAAIGLPIALSGTVGYLMNGLNAAGLPPHCLGYIHIPSLTGIALASYLTAPYGARLAHRLPVARLRKGFALLLLVMGTRMLLSLA
jgi:uncharacterized membrane protein YfcA